MTKREDSLKAKLIKMSMRCRYYNNGNCDCKKFNYFVDNKIAKKECNAMECYDDYEVHI